MVGDKVVCDKNVCQRWWVTKWLCDKDGGPEVEAAAEEEEAGYRIKNKKPTQRCGEKHSVSRLSHLFPHLDLLSSETFSFFDLLSSSLLFSSLNLPISTFHLSISLDV